MHHRRGLRRLLNDDDLLTRIEADWTSAGLDDRRATMLAYAEKLTLTPSEVKEADVQLMRGHDFSDRDVLDVCEIVGYYAFANRMANGLGVTLENRE